MNTFQQHKAKDSSKDAVFPAYTGTDQPFDLSFAAYDACTLCPKRCRAARNKGVRGLCGANNTVRVARSALHFWEEPPISGTRGSGAIFFSGCPLRCVFCQNFEISTGNFGIDVSCERLAQMMLELQDQGALNINLVTALHFAPHIQKAVFLAKKHGLKLPIVCNTAGFESAGLVRALKDTIDVWLPDFKFSSPQFSFDLCRARNYPTIAEAALRAMIQNVAEKGGRRILSDGRMRQGIIVRHLVMPRHTQDSLRVLDTVWEIAHNQVDISIMNQYTANKLCREKGGFLSEAVGHAEYERVLQYADDLGFEHLWWQQGGTVSESFVPEFDATGVKGPELSDRCAPQQALRSSFVETPFESAAFEDCAQRAAEAARRFQEKG